ncbi:DUF4190 domain-containing protein [Microbacterium sp. MPKO10]|uniref:DUF4190 domain-containing protein n=1 Tax=Microbacterium sp. MPKO10 TaxID=2989818 RepID=UPI0022356B41|nr:DUF4190 domain-containing protein [Microbacterium sp. MPKO10]MCW4457120.1 DUF4190 domain-containing protein [Microbacterium sp. MPKO10]
MSTPSAPQPYSGAAPKRTNSMAVTSICLAGGGFLASFLIGILCLVALAGGILGFIALNKIKTTGEAGRGLAIAGIVVGLAGFVIGGILYALSLVVTFSMM